VQLAAAAGAAVVDMGEVQVHPTAFVDPKNQAAKSVILASESLRQAGAVLVNSEGHRFCDERVDIASAIVAKMGGGQAPDAKPMPTWLVLPPKVAEAEAGHIGFYLSKGLLAKHESVAELAKALNVGAAALEESVGVAADEGPVICGEVAPAVHYSLGGVRVDASARALSAAATPVPGLFVAGEAAGGIHGRNRIAGNGLLESVVFGRLAGRGAAEARVC